MSPRRILVEGLEQRRLLSAGDLDPFFGNAGVANIVLNGEPSVVRMARQTGGKIVAAAPIYLRRFGIHQLEMVRFGPDGQVDTSFGDGGKLILPRAFAGEPREGMSGPLIDSHRRILLYANGKLMRFTPAGRYDRSFGDRGIVKGAGAPLMRLVKGDRILAAIGTTISRYLSDGTADKSFGKNGSATFELPFDTDERPFFATNIAIRNDGTILLNVRIGLEYTSAGISGGVVRFAGDGRFDRSFGDHGFAGTMPLDEDIVPAESVFTSDGGSVTLMTHIEGGSWLVKLTPDGQFDRKFGDRGVSDLGEFDRNDAFSASGAALFRQAGDKLLAVVDVETDDDHAGLVRTTSDGEADPGFSGNGKTLLGRGSVTDAVVGQNQDIVYAATDADPEDLNLVQLVAVQTEPPTPPDPFASLNSSGTLSVVGTGKNDVIQVSRTGTKIVGTRNGSSLSFDAAVVRQIWADGFGGNDRIVNQTSLPSTLLGESGNDTLSGGGGSDSLDGGSGENVADYSTRGLALDVNLGWNGFGSTLGEVHRHGGGSEVDTIWSCPTILSGRGNDSLTLTTFPPEGFANPNDSFELDGGAGNDSFDVAIPDGIHPEVVFNGGAGNDSLFFTSRALETLIGGDGDDRFFNDLTGHDQEVFANMNGGRGHDVLDYYGDEALEVTIPPGIEDFLGGGVYSVTGNSLNNLIRIIYPSDTGRHIDVFATPGEDRVEYRLRE